MRRSVRGIWQAAASLLVIGVAVACGPADSGSPGGPVSASPTATASATASPTPEATPLVSATPTGTAAASGTPTATAKATATATAVPKAPASSRPAVTATPPRVKPPVSPSLPPPRDSGDAKPTAACEIVSNAGNCYNAGQYCRAADVGRSTHAGNGRIIHCREDGNRNRWEY
ncbi:hypothetical protein [Streptomyces sp. NPDC089799]|uniref:hypothetical protein n=1 Tax=Streptomyces sp. NPDC089799 TaxID=3155066 RepID=UPI00343DC4F5